MIHNKNIFSPPEKKIDQIGRPGRNGKDYGSGDNVKSES